MTTMTPLLATDVCSLLRELHPDRSIVLSTLSENLNQEQHIGNYVRPSGEKTRSNKTYYTFEDIFCLTVFFKFKDFGVHMQEVVNIKEALYEFAKKSDEHPHLYLIYSCEVFRFVKLIEVPYILGLCGDVVAVDLTKTRELLRELVTFKNGIKLEAA